MIKSCNNGRRQFRESSVIRPRFQRLAFALCVYTIQSSAQWSVLCHSAPDIHMVDCAQNRPYVEFVIVCG